MNIELNLRQRNMIRDLAGAPHHVPVVLIEGSARAPQYTGETYYWTTPSGKTRVEHPNAYGWPTVYHASTLQVEVGTQWVLMVLTADAHRNRLVDAVEERLS